MANDWDNVEKRELEENIQKYEDAERKGEPIYMEPDELTNIAEYYYNDGRIDKAIQTLSYAIQLFPSSAIPLVFRARIALLDEKNPKLAARLAEQVGDKTDYEYLYLKAEIMIEERHADEADKYLRETFDTIFEEDRPDYVLDVATLFADYNQFALADKWLSLSEDKDLADYKELKGRIATAQGNYSESERIFSNLLDEDPFSSHFWNRLASSQMMQNRMKDAIASSEFSIAINPKDEEAIINKANSLFCLAQFEEALKYYKRYTELRPQSYLGYMNLGNTLLNLNRTEEAVKQYMKAEELLGGKEEDAVELYQEIALAQSALGRISEAIKYAQKAAQCPNADQTEILVLKGHIYLEHGNVEKSKEYYEEAIKQAVPVNKGIKLVAVSAYDCGYYNIAAKLFKMIVKSTDNTQNEGYAYLASCCQYLGKEREFKKYLKKACELNTTETKLIFSPYFPTDIEAKDYYDYITNKKKEI